MFNSQPMISTLFTELWEVRFKDIDPDTGYESQNRIVALCFSEKGANDLKEILTRDYMTYEDNPNREFFIKPVKFEFNELV